MSGVIWATAVWRSATAGGPPPPWPRALLREWTAAPGAYWQEARGGLWWISVYRHDQA